MLDFIYYPVSAVLWFWHSAFALVLGPAGSLGWVLAIVFLVVTVRAALFLPFRKQARTQAVMARLQPRIKAIQQKYKDDPRQRMTETQQLYKTHAIRPFAGLLPMVGQAFVFIGLFHVLRSFDRTVTLAHLPFGATAAPMSAEQNAVTPNYLFGATDVQAFLHADLFGAPLSGTVTGAGMSVALVALR